MEYNFTRPITGGDQLLISRTRITIWLQEYIDPLPLNEEARLEKLDDVIRKAIEELDRHARYRDRDLVNTISELEKQWAMESYTPAE